MPDAYRSHPGIAFSDMKIFALESPKAFYDTKIAGTRKRVSSAAMRSGTLCHMATLERGRFDALPLCPAEHLTDSGSLSTKKATKDWIASLGDQMFVTAAEREQCLAISLAAWSNKQAYPLLSNGAPQFEVEAFAQRDGVEIKGKSDILRPGLDVWDLKTTDNLDSIVAQCRDFAYPEQVAWYQDLHGVSAGGLIVVEKDDLHRVAVITFEPAVMAAARRRIAAWWAHYRSCLAASEWPNDPPSVLTITAAQLAAA